MTSDEIERLGVEGWFHRDDFAGAAAAGVAAQHRVDSAQLRPARISRAHTANTAVRGDSTMWLSADDVDFTGLRAMFENLRCEINRDAWLGLARFELQLAHYAGGGAEYVRHRDAFEGTESRRLTAIAYLNPAWRRADGGELRLYPALANEPATDLAPLLGRVVVFLSAKVEHAVLPTWASRLAATAWYYGA